MCACEGRCETGPGPNLVERTDERRVQAADGGRERERREADARQLLGRHSPQALRVAGAERVVPRSCRGAQPARDTSVQAEQLRNERWMEEAVEWYRSRSLGVTAPRRASDEQRQQGWALTDRQLALDRAQRLEVNALQRAATIVFQKSTREGFGLGVEIGRASCRERVLPTV